MEAAEVGNVTEYDPKYDENLAGVLYDHYCDAVGGLAFNGDPLPKWPEFRGDPNKAKQSNAWVEVAKRSRLALTQGF